MTLAVITPSYRNDWPLFTDLHQSVLLHTDESVKHYVVVPDADMRLFSQVAGPRCVVLAEESLYPHHYRSVRAVNRLMHFMPRIPPSARIAAVNLKRPFRPSEGGSYSRPSRWRRAAESMRTSCFCSIRTCCL